MIGKKSAKAKAPAPDLEWEDLLTPEEAAALLTVTVQRLAEWRMGRGDVEIPYYKLGKFIRYRKSELLKYLRQNEHTFTVEYTMR